MPAQHVFLFRHCVRTAYRHIDLNDASNNNNNDENPAGPEDNDDSSSSSSSSKYPTDLADYLGVPLPNWHAAGEGQCTRAGLDTLKGTGKFLLRDYLAKKYQYQYDTGTIDRQYLHVDFRADILSQNDVDSAWALQQGMASIIHNENNDDDDDDDYHEQQPVQLPFILQGLGTIQNDAEFFHPTLRNGFSSNENENEMQEPICNIPPETPESTAAKNQVLQSRLDSIAMPGNLDDLINAIDELGDTDISKAGPLRLIQPRLDINRHTSKLAGAVVAVSRLGELAYLARASGYPFFVNADVSGIYNMLAWHDWRRAVTDIGTSDAAVPGAIKVSRILNLLAGQSEPQLETADAQSHHHRATFLMGHDDDFAAVATALGLTWTLPAPYTSGGRTGNSGDYSAIPPGAALHFYYNPDDDNDDDDDSSSRVHMSILAPVMISHPPPSHHQAHDDDEEPHYFETLNTSGILEERHVTFSPSLAQVMQDEFRTDFFDINSPLGEAQQQPSMSNAKTGIDHLRDRLVNVLSAYPQAMECLNNVTQKSRPDQYATDNVLFSSLSSSPSSSVSPTYLPAGAAVSVTLALSLLLMGVVLVIFGTKRLKMGRKQNSHWFTPATTSCIDNHYPVRLTSQTEMTCIITAGSEP